MAEIRHTNHCIFEIHCLPLCTNVSGTHVEQRKIHFHSGHSPYEYKLGYLATLCAAGRASISLATLNLSIYSDIAFGASN